MINQNGKLFATNYCQRQDFKKIKKKDVKIKLNVI